MELLVSIKTRHQVLLDIIEIPYIGALLILVLGFALPMLVYLVISLVAWILGVGDYFMKWFLRIQPPGFAVIGTFLFVWDFTLRNKFQSTIKFMWLPLWLWGFVYLAIGVVFTVFGIDVFDL